MILGLHTCQPGNEPQVGQVKTFVVENRVAASGKAWVKIKSASAEKGGTPYTIKTVAPTGHTDSYGNVSFNLGIEHAALSAQPMQQNAVQGNVGAPRGMSKDDYWTRKEERDIEVGATMNRCHAQEMALRYFACAGYPPRPDENVTVAAWTTTKLREMIDWFVRDSKRQPLSAVEQQAKTMFNATESPKPAQPEPEEEMF